eukprot:6470503-Alexandrium_andersonii.AAC.1
MDQVQGWGSRGATPAAVAGCHTRGRLPGAGQPRNHTSCGGRAPRALAAASHSVIWAPMPLRRR